MAAAASRLPVVAEEEELSLLTYIDECIQSALRTYLRDKSSDLPYRDEVSLLLETVVGLPILLQFLAAFITEDLASGMNPKGKLYHVLMVDLLREFEKHSEWKAENKEYGQFVTACTDQAENFINHKDRVSELINLILNAYTARPKARHKDIASILKPEITIDEVVKFINEIDGGIKPDGSLYEALTKELPTELLKKGQSTEVVEARLLPLRRACADAVARHEHKLAQAIFVKGVLVYSSGTPPRPTRGGSTTTPSTPGTPGSTGSAHGGAGGPST